MNTFLAVFLGGGLGSLCRYGISQLMQRIAITEFPLATLSANVLSTLLLGYVVLKTSPESSSWQYALITIGFCGGFSTFSTFSLETFQLIKNENLGWAAANVLISVVACIALLLLLSKQIKS